MRTLSKNVRPESAARDRRVAALISAIIVQHPAEFSEEAVIELCLAFDQAVEFAACEDKSVATVIADFFAEDWGPAQRALKKLIVPAKPFVPSKLPVLPRAAAQLLRTSDEATSSTELARIAASDPALAAELLRAANSALYGSRWQISRIGEAVLRLGVPVTRKTLFAASFATLFTVSPLDGLWQHSRYAAETALQLAGFCGVDQDTAYAAGLLHDIGRIAFTAFPPSMRAAERMWRACGFPLIYAETIAYGSDHAAFGATLLRSWQLPEEIADAVARHHRPEHTNSPLRAIIHLAEAEDEDLWSNMRRKAALDQSGITPEQYDLVLAGKCGSSSNSAGQAHG